MPAREHEPLPVPHEGARAEAGRVESMLVSGSAKAALELARSLNKRESTPETETLLVRTYERRVVEMLAGGLVAEAGALADLVESRYVSAGERVPRWRHWIAARRGDVSELLRPLADPDLAASERDRILDVIRHWVVDPAAVAACQTLPEDHPLRAQGRSVADAFAAAASGPVDEDAVALLDVPRRSPFAPWKSFARALAAFYRRDDVSAQELLGLVPDDAACSPLARALRAMVGGRRPASASPAVRELMTRVVGDEPALRTSLDKLDAAFAKGKRGKIMAAVREAFAEAERSCPGIVERLRQHVGVRCALRDLATRDVTRAMGGRSPKTAHFWRLHARATELHAHREHDAVALLGACSRWEEFRRGAVIEGWFLERSPEAAAVYLHMADLLSGIAPHDLADAQSIYLRECNDRSDVREAYAEQPPHIRARALDERSDDAYFVYPERVLRRACEADPASGTYERRLEWTRKNGSSPKEADRVAEEWHAARPGDAPPLLALMESAEARGSLSKARKYLEKAERIDGPAADVRRARTRLCMGIALGHLRRKNMRLYAKDLDVLAGLPQTSERGARACLCALRWFGAALSKDAAAKDASRLELDTELGGPLAARVLLSGTASACGKSETPVRKELEPPEPAPPAELGPAVVSACEAAGALDLEFELQREYAPTLLEGLRESDCGLDAQGLYTLARAALRQEFRALAYASSGRGSRHGGHWTARMLLCRAESLPAYDESRRRECLAAALRLAQQSGDTALVGEVLEAHGRASRGPRWSFFDDEEPLKPADEKQAKSCIEREREDMTYPSEPSPARAFNGFDFGFDYDEEEGDTEPCTCPECTRRRQKASHSVDDDDEFDDDDPGSGLPVPTAFEVESVTDGVIETFGSMGMPREVIRAVVAAAGMGKGRMPSVDELLDRFPELLDGAAEADAPPAFGSLRGRRRRRQR